MTARCADKSKETTNSQVDDLWATKSEDVGLIVCAISFQDFQPMWSWSTNDTDGRTDRQDRQTDRRHAIARPRFAL